MGGHGQWGLSCAGKQLRLTHLACALGYHECSGHVPRVVHADTDGNDSVRDIGGGHTVKIALCNEVGMRPEFTLTTTRLGTELQTHHPDAVLS